MTTEMAPDSEPRDMSLQAGVTAGVPASAMPWRSPTFVWIAGLLGVALIGGIDYLSGVELRVYPLYYLPISLVAWYRSRSSSLVVAGFSTVTWVVSNYLADLRFSSPALWVVNAIMQASSFSIIGVLISGLRVSLMNERTLSRTDALTSLLNSRAFYDEGARLLALCRRNRRPITVAYIDLDNFKSVNDTLGHPAGDLLLTRIAAVLRASLRPSDLSARLGGDEFALLLPEVNSHDALLTLERLRALLAEAFGGVSNLVGATVGAVVFIAPAASMEEMVQRADAAMYRAKAAGKNRVHLEVAGALPAA